MRAFKLKSLSLTILALCLCLSLSAEQVDWEASWNASGKSEGLQLETKVGDGLVEKQKIKGRQAVEPLGYFYYFNVEDDFARRIGMDMTLEVEILDAEEGPVILYYDAMTPQGRVSYHPSNAVMMKGSGQWTRVSFSMPDAWLDNGQNLDADMRIALMGIRLPLASARLVVNALEGQTWPDEQSRQQARREIKLSSSRRKIEQALSELIQAGQPWRENAALLPDEVLETFKSLEEIQKQAIRDLRSQMMAEEEFLEDEPLFEYIKRLQEQLEKIQNISQLLERLRAADDFIAEAGRGSKDWLFFSRSAMQNNGVLLPWTLPSPAEVGAPVFMQACRGEYEPFSLGLFSRYQVDSVTMFPSDLVTPEGETIPASALDIRVCQRWYQAGRGHETMGSRQLVPELVLHDDSLVEIDLVEQKNILNFDDSPHDAEELQPFTLQPLLNKFLWVTLHVPVDASAGTYRGTIEITGDNDELDVLTVPLLVEVLPFELRKNPKIASMYFKYRIDRFEGSEEHYRNMLINMKEHGLTNPVFRAPVKNGRIDMDLAARELTLRQETGVNQGPLLMIGGYSVASYLHDKSPEEEKRSKLLETVQDAATLAERFGYTDSYIYGIDEAAGEELAAEIPVFKLLDELGGKAWAAALSDFPKIALNEFHLPNYCGTPEPEIVDAVHEAGHKIIRYAGPQSGAEDPWLWRYLYGLVLWETGLDGGCTWTYRGLRGDPWDDFDGPGTYRDFMMTYPGEQQPIDTVQWEAYREANDDLRYMATLEHALELARMQGNSPNTVAEVDQWFSNRRELPFYGQNMDAVRARIIAHILALTE